MARRSAMLLAPAWIPEHDVPLCPYQDLGRAQKRAITSAIRAAWDSLPGMAKRMDINLRTAKEDVFSMLLQNELNRILCDESEPVASFTEEIFQLISRGENLPDYTNQKTQKSPDITIRPRVCPRRVARRELYGMFVECKLIDDRFPVRLYGVNGIKKFVDGAYAWMMPSAMMVAYVRDGSDPVGCLQPHLAKQEFRDDYGRPETLRAFGEKGGPGPGVYASTHQRDFKIGTHSPGTIELAHLWLRLD